MASAAPAALDAAAQSAPAAPATGSGGGVEEAGAAAALELLEDLMIPEIENPTVLAGLQENALKMLGVTAVGTVATYVSTAQLDVVGAKISMDLRKRIFGNVLDQGTFVKRRERSIIGVIGFECRGSFAWPNTYIMRG